MSSNAKKARTLKQPKIWPADKPLTGLKASIEEEDYERLIPKQRFTSKEWLEKEYKLMWAKVWQWACREEEIPNPGDYFEYKIGDQSVVIVRAPDGEEYGFRFFSATLAFCPSQPSVTYSTTHSVLLYVKLKRPLVQF